MRENVARAMGRNFELDIFRVLQRRQKLFIKVAILRLSVSAAFFVLSTAFRWPLFLALIPMALTGPFVMSVRPLAALIAKDRYTGIFSASSAHSIAVHDVDFRAGDFEEMKDILMPT